jgi:hypothetical protein
VASVYLTTAPKDRARAVHQAIDAVQGLSSIWEPVGQMERVATGPLPELDAFLPRWVRYLERRPTPAEAWESGRDHWLREAVRRLEGIAGLERIARKTRKPETVRAWCDAVVEERDWGEALRAYDAATRLVRGSDWRGMFLDGAALAARELGRPDARRLHAAWLGAPSLVRLLRWLGAGSPPATALVKRARQAIRRCPKKAGRQLGLLYILTGNVVAAAELLEAAPGLGWSSEDHPGHVVFPAFAALLAGRARAKLGPQFFARLQEAPRDPFDTAIGEDGDVERPTLSTPSVGDLIATAGSGAGIDAKSRDAMLQAMRRATRKRVEGLVGNKRRDHLLARGDVARLLSGGRAGDRHRAGSPGVGGRGPPRLFPPLRIPGGVSASPGLHGVVMVEACACAVTRGPPGDPSQPMSRHLARDWWERTEKAAVVARVPGRGWHSLRRKFATELKGASLKDLCALGGWTDHNTILKCYEQVDPEAMRVALERRGTLRGV